MKKVQQLFNSARHGLFGTRAPKESPIGLAARAGKMAGADDAALMEQLEKREYLFVLTVDQFDPSFDRDFLSYAVPTIRGELRKHFRDAGWTVRPPRRVQELQQRIGAARGALEQELSRSPRRPVYPACSNDSRAEGVTLGTSPGWADIYPPAYPEQWIDVTGLRGCFAYVHIADPENGIFETNEDNNEAQTIVRLPFNEKRRRHGCRGSDRGRTFDPTDNYYTVG